MARVWRAAKQRIGFVAHHTTKEGRVFIDRIQVSPEARGTGAGARALRWVAGGSPSELQCRRANKQAMRLYQGNGYLITETGEYPLSTQRRDAAGRTIYTHMRAARVAAYTPDTERRAVTYTTGEAEAVPGDMWRWMEQSIMDNDKVKQATARGILRGEDPRMRYTLVAVSTEVERQGRGGRPVRVSTYRETRHKEPNGTRGELKVDRAGIHMRARHGRELQHGIARLAEDG